MAKKIQKTFKVEFEITVSMDELEDRHLDPEPPTGQLEHLRALQQALLPDEPALTELMLAIAISKLQERMDYLAAQDDLDALMRVTETLDTEDWKFFQKYNRDFDSLTRPLRGACLSVKLDSNIIQEQTQGEAGDPTWQPVWEDLIPKTELGRQLEGFSIPKMMPHYLTGENRHHLQARYFSRQKDGIHIEGVCSCGKVLESVAPTEEEAPDRLWEAFRAHYQSYQLDDPSSHSSFSTPNSRNQEENVN